ncbi:papain-like cysteine protease family protein [Streptosporangium sp. NPDC002607]
MGGRGRFETPGWIAVQPAGGGLGGRGDQFGGLPEVDRQHLKDVTASRLDSSGNSESVTIRGTASSKVLAEATMVPHLRQTRQNDCWAVSAAMLIGWRKQGAISVEDAVGAAGEKYRQLYTDDTGLYTEDKDDFVLRSRMVAEPAASYRLEQYVDWLKTYGPLWMTRDAGPGQLFSPHAWVLIRISGTGTPDGVGTDFTLIDPNTGTEETLTFAEFVRGYEDIAREEAKGQALRPQVVRFLEPIPKPKPEGYLIEGPFNKNEPVHETVTLAALLGSTVPVPSRPRPGPDQAVNEFLRGVLWNDDPAVLLFDEDRTDNWKFSTGASWLFAFTLAGKAVVNNVTNLTGRSHYFDLQFLHAMAETVGERPEDTLAKIMLWAEVMYRLSIGEGVTGADRLDAVPIASHVTAADGTAYSTTLADFFTAASLPRGSDTLQTLLTHDTACTSLDLPRRAIGSLLHLLQDSYARGHVRRVLLNPGDLLPGKTDEFTPGTYGRFGDVENFHCYRGQDHKLHEKYDTPTATVRVTDPSSFNSLLGARDAIKASTSLLEMWHAATPWAAADGPKHLLEGTVFKIAATATPSDTTI